MNRLKLFTAISSVVVSAPVQAQSTSDSADFAVVGTVPAICVGGSVTEAIADGIREGTRSGYLRWSVTGDPTRRLRMLGEDAPGRQDDGPVGQQEHEVGERAPDVDADAIRHVSPRPSSPRCAARCADAIRPAR